MSCSLLEEIEAALIDVGDKELQPNVVMHINMATEQSARQGGINSISWSRGGKSYRSVQATGGYIYKKYADELGMTTREWEEFMEAFDRVRTPDLYEKPADFKLDLATAVPVEVLRREAMMSAPREL